MSAKDRFNQPLDFYTEEEWKEPGTNIDWEPAKRVAKPEPQSFVRKETPR